MDTDIMYIVHCTCHGSDLFHDVIVIIVDVILLEVLHPVQIMIIHYVEF